MTTKPAGVGHNSEPVAADRLRSYVERIETLNGERKDISDTIKDVYHEAKSTGFDVAVLRQLIALRKKDADKVEEQQIVLETYRSAIA